MKGWGVRCTSPIQIIIDFFGGREAMTGNVSALHRLMHSRLNWNLEVLVFEERGNQSSLEKISWRRAEN